MFSHLVILFEQIQYLFLVYLAITNLTATTMIWNALQQMISNYFCKTDTLLYSLYHSNAYKPISILSPAYNEEKTIVSSVNSLLQLDFKEYEIVVINDGSNDSTLHKLITNFDLFHVSLPNNLTLKHQKIRGLYHSHQHKNLIVIDKENGGKADALNSGLNLATYPLVCCVDSDTILEKDSLLRGLESFIKDRRLIALGGAIGITNGSRIENHTLKHKKVPNNPIEGFQILEYLRGFFAGRTGWVRNNGLLLISGAFGIFRKDIMLNVGGYRHTIGEDFDLLVRMRRYCYDNKIEHRVDFVPEILCWTQCPSDYSSLLKQRNRWHRGLMDTLLYNRKMIFNPKYGIVGLVTLPYFVFIEAFNPIVTFIGVLSIIVLYAYGTINPQTIVLFFILEFIWGILLNIFALYLDIFSRHPFESLFSYIKLLILGIFEPFIFKPIMKAELLGATFNFMNSNWGEIKRKAL
jgi:cellulose synthase/poly-beta-1,6-N-acetylglucosamine synthase-like glycosyltransferase